MKKLICLCFTVIMITQGIVALGNADRDHNACRQIQTSTYA